MKTVKILAMAVFVLTVMISSAFAQDYPTPENPVTFKGGHVLPSGSTQDRTCKAWAELVRERTNGAVNIEVFPSEQLGVEKSLTESVNLGIIDWAFFGPGSLARFTPEFGIFENAYTFQGNEHLKNTAFNEDFIEYLSAILEEKSNLKFLGFQWYGHRNALADKPILTPEDGEGLRIRVPDVPSYRIAAAAMGATATPLPFGEVYMALKQGLVDACEGNNENIYNMKFYEVKKVITLTSHIEAITCVVMNTNSMSVLSPEQQEIVLQSAYETWLEYLDGYQQIDKEFRAKLEAEGVEYEELTAEQFKTFRNRAMELLKEEDIPAWGETWTKFNELAE
jgi:tripartite ATP-independent transporter DctP family solute receptor